MGTINHKCVERAQNVFHVKVRSLARYEKNHLDEVQAFLKKAYNMTTFYTEIHIILLNNTNFWFFFSFQVQNGEAECRRISYEKISSLEPKPLYNYCLCTSM